MDVEVVLIEDPACGWCWAFQPQETTLLFEYAPRLVLRRVMGGLRDRPLAHGDFFVEQWEEARHVSGMPFEPEVWHDHVIETTYLACTAVKAASLVEPRRADRFLRRLRESFFLERTPIDNLESILRFARESGIDTEKMCDHLESGRASSLFARDRAIASRNGFGFPTILVRHRRDEGRALLQGLVPYSDIVRALAEVGISPAFRCRFTGRREDWDRLFRLRPRITLPEIEHLTGLRRREIESKLASLGATREGHLWSAPPRAAAAQSSSRTREPVGVPHL